MSSTTELNIIGTITDTIIAALRLFEYLFHGNDYSHRINVIFKRAKISIETLEDRYPSKAYPRIVDRSDDKNTIFYALPLGLNFEQVEKSKPIFESAFKLKKVSITRLANHPRADFSIKIEEFST